MSRQPGLIETAERVAAVLADNGFEATVFAAFAFDAHEYVRDRQDIDLDIMLPVPGLAAIAAKTLQRIATAFEASAARIA
jgi:hypothetical protein